MAIKVDLRFVGTGKPVRVNVNPRVNREPSRKGIRFTGVDTRRDFRQLIKTEMQPSIEELGNNAVKIIRASGIDLSV